MVVTMIVGASQSAAEVEKIDYSTTIQSVGTYRDSIEGLITELEMLSRKTFLTTEEQARADRIMLELSDTSLSMKKALENGAEGFDTLSQKAAVARDEMEKTELALRNLLVAQALQSLRDADNEYGNAIGKAQENAQSAASYGVISDMFQQYMEENPSGLYLQRYTGNRFSTTVHENFYTYARNKATQSKSILFSEEENARIQAEKELWTGIVKELDKLSLDMDSSVEEINNRMLEFNIAMGSVAGAAEQELAQAWQPVFKDLYTIMAESTSFAQLPQY